MKVEELEEIVRGAFQQVFRLDAVPPDTSPDTFEEWDSLNHINLMLELEARLGININTREYAEMISYQAIVENLRNRVEGKG